jgi:TolA-binding protein
MTTQNMKEELTKIWKTSEKRIKQILEIKNPFSQTKNTEESHSSRLEQVEDRISELEDKIEIKEKAELLVKQLLSCEKNSVTPSKDQT